MTKNNRILTLRLVAAIICALLPFGPVPAQTGDLLRADHPGRYVVQEGDTLWGIANRFLNDPWRWAEIWEKNEAVTDPNLIFPGDLLVVTSAYRIKAVRAASVRAQPKQSVRLQPRIHARPIDRAIATIPPHVVEPFLTAAGIVDPGELEAYGHVVGGIDGELLLGKYYDFYARNLDTAGIERHQKYQIFRTGRALHHPETGELLGVESIHVGEARLQRAGDDVSRLRVTSANREVRPGDRLLVAPAQVPLPRYQPRAPAEKLSGLVLYAPSGVNAVGEHEIIIITGGAEDGLEEGHVLKTLYHSGTHIDPITKEEFQIPAEQSGLILVVKVFAKLSYALVVQSAREIVLGDPWETP